MDYSAEEWEDDQYYMRHSVAELEDKIHETAQEIQTLEHQKVELLGQVQKRILFDIEKRSG